MAESYDACSFALGRGEYCKGDRRFPETHAGRCPHYFVRAADPAATRAEAVRVAVEALRSTTVTPTLFAELAVDAVLPYLRVRNAADLVRAIKQAIDVMRPATVQEVGWLLDGMLRGAEEAGRG